MTETRIISPDVEKRIWGEEGYRVFLSHKSEVKIQTAQLKKELKQFGVSCFVAHEDIEPTKDWQVEIENALLSMNALVALMTEKFHESDWTDQEVGFALGRRVPIVSLKLGRGPYGFLWKFQAVSCLWDSAAIEIIKTLLKHDQVDHDQLLDAYIKAVRKCENFAEANRLSKVLPSIVKLSDQQANDLISAFNENDQVRYSYGFLGDDPQKDGNGLVHYLNQLTSCHYEVSDSGIIEVKP
jgi:hypothetical protein